MVCAAAGCEVRRDRNREDSDSWRRPCRDMVSIHILVGGRALRHAAGGVGRSLLMAWLRESVHLRMCKSGFALRRCAGVDRHQHLHEQHHAQQQTGDAAIDAARQVCGHGAESNTWQGAVKRTSELAPRRLARRIRIPKDRRPNASANRAGRARNGAVESIAEETPAAVGAAWTPPAAAHARDPLAAPDAWAPDRRS